MSLRSRLTSFLVAPLRAYDEAAKRYPAMVGIVTTVLKTSAADVFAQKVVEQRENIDWKRNRVFTTFGLAYLGCWQYHLYHNIFVKFTPTIHRVFGPSKAATAVTLTFLDQCVHHPLMYFPCFYLLRGSIAGEPLVETAAHLRHDLWDNMKALWSVWVPAQLVNFSIVPLHLRIPYVAGVSFAWTVILSLMRGTVEAASLSPHIDKEEDSHTEASVLPTHDAPSQPLPALQSQTANLAEL